MPILMFAKASSNFMENYSQQIRTLVTGGAGFLGSHLCERLVAEGHDVYCKTQGGASGPKGLYELRQSLDRECKELRRGGAEGYAHAKQFKSIEPIAQKMHE